MIRFKENIEEAKIRLEAWWNHEDPGRALIQVRGSRKSPIYSVPPVEPKDHHDYWTSPDVVLPRILNEAGSTWFGGEAFPVLFPVPGRMVSITCKYLGAPNLYLDNQTTWSAPIIESWDTMPSLDWNPENSWWKMTLRNMECCAAHIIEHGLECFMGLPDLNGPTEVLSGLRNPEKMCLDLILEPDAVKTAAVKVQEAWFQAWRGTTEIAHRFGGYFNWMGLWSEIPAIDLQSDFSSLISPSMFEEFILPLVREQAESFPRSIFHLDGPDMVRHLDLLLAVRDIDAIQWVQGAGAGPVSDWMDVMRRIQKSGKGLYIYCEAREVEYLLKNLDSRTLMMVVTDELTETEAKEIVGLTERFS